MKDREPKFVGKPFPISNASTEEVLSTVLNTRDKVSAEDAQKKEMQILLKHYPDLSHVQRALSAIALDPRINQNPRLLLLGFVIGFKTLRYEAYLKGGQLAQPEGNGVLQQQLDDAIPFLDETATDTDVILAERHQRERLMHLVQKEGPFYNAVSNRLASDMSIDVMCGVSNIYSIYNEPNLH